MATSEAAMQAFSFASHTYEKFHLLMPVFLIRRWEGSSKPRRVNSSHGSRPRRSGTIQPLRPTCP